MPPITLLTDFGTGDVFVGVMKGVIAGIRPGASVIDLTHAVPPQDVAAGAFYLAMAYPYFPAGTIHVAVVDPGVGTARRAVAVSAHGQFFVAPDNGLLAGVLAGAAAWEAVELTNPDYRLPATSATFHGRDVFAPAGAHLAAGVPLAAFGPPVETLAPGSLPEAVSTADGVAGQICWIDHFGNLVSNIRGGTLPPGWRLELAGRTLGSAGCYGDVAPGELVALVNSFGYVEAACRNGNAAAALGVKRGEPVRVTWPTRPARTCR